MCTLRRSCSTIHFPRRISGKLQSQDPMQKVSLYPGGSQQLIPAHHSDLPFTYPHPALFFFFFSFGLWRQYFGMQELTSGSMPEICAKLFGICLRAEGTAVGRAALEAVLKPIMWRNSKIGVEEQGTRLPDRSIIVSTSFMWTALDHKVTTWHPTNT